MRIGFRADAEPFSYKVNGDGGNQIGSQPLYKGFLADLCYWIFDGGDYSVVEMEVNADDCFSKLERGEIDVLCDPVTMRFSDEKRMKAGIFSPIVFATGISYVVRRSRAGRDPVFIGYVENTTVETVLEHVCLVDLFRAVPAEERAELATMCQTAIAARRVAAEEEDWDGAWTAANDEHTSCKQRAEEEKGPRKEQLEKRRDMWAEAMTHIARCKDDSNCKLPDIVNRFGVPCEAVKPGIPGEMPDDLKGTADDSTVTLDLKVRPDSSLSRRTVYRFCPKLTHNKIIEWFCEPRTGQDVPTLVYIGDREIILGKLQTWNKEHGPECVVENETGGDDLTYEPYALMVAKPSIEETPARVQDCRNGR